jgi:hypothetical protein
MPIEQLETITKNYPWFSLAHSYLAKAYQENNSHKASGQIALASTLHSNRTWLYSFLKEPILQKQDPVEAEESLPTEMVAEEVVETTPVVVPPSTSLSDLAASMLEEEQEQEVREDKRGEEEVREEVREDKREEEKVSEEIIEDKKEEEEVRELDFLDKSILATAVSSSIFLEVSEADEELDAAQDSTKDVAQVPAEEGESNALFTWLRSVSDEEIHEEIREVKKGEEEGREVIIFSFSALPPSPPPPPPPSPPPSPPSPTALLSCYRKCGAHALTLASCTAKVQVGRVRVRHERKARVPQVPDKRRLNASRHRLAAAWHPETHETHTPSAQPRAFPVRGDAALGEKF